MARPFTKKAFPDAVQIVPVIYAAGAIGATSRVDGPAPNSLTMALVLFKVGQAIVAGTDSEFATSGYSVSFAANPGVVEGQVILWGVIRLVCLSTAAPVFRQRAWRVHCVQRL